FVHNKIPVSECIISETGIYTNCGRGSVEWGNSLYRQHDFAGYKKLSYGLFVGGNINKKKAALTHYGPFINWQQPIWKD
ncbi:hypothetical protein Q7429_11355, partial [Glaesserella parasuis]|nr:hypothetical protein [Glaesserella parasuis]